MSTEDLGNTIDSVERLQTLNNFMYLQKLFQNKFHKDQRDGGMITNIPLHDFQNPTNLIRPSILLYPNVPFVKLDNYFHKLRDCVKDMKDVSVDTNPEYYVYLHDKSLGQTQILHNVVNNELNPTYIIHVYGKDCEFVTEIYGQIYIKFQYLVEKIAQEAFPNIDEKSLFYTLVENFPNVQQNNSVEYIVQRTVDFIKEHIDIYLVIV